MTRKRQRSASTRDSATSDRLPTVQSEQKNPAVRATPLEQQENDNDSNWIRLDADVHDSNNNSPCITGTTTMTLSSVDTLDGELKTDAVKREKDEVTTTAAATTTEQDVKPPRPPPPPRRAVVWFRRDLRLHDNLALDAAIRAQEQLQKDEGEEMALIPIYILHRPKRLRCGAIRFQFLLEAIEDLAKSLKNLHSLLLVLRGEAEEVLRVVLAAWGITDLFFEAGVMPYAVQRDDNVHAIAKSLDVKVTTTRGVTLYDPHEIIRLNGGRAPTDYERMLEITDNMQQPAQPIDAPTKLSNAAVFSATRLFKILEDFNQQDPSAINIMAGVDRDAKKTAMFVVPPLTVLGLTPPDPHAPLFGGESEAMKRLDAFCKDKRRVGLFEKPKTSPVAVDAPSTTTLSAYLCFGCLSAREFFYRIMFIQLQFPLRPGPTQVTLEGQLMWREFFYCYACGTPNFDSQERNPGCKQIEWRLLNEEHVLRPEYLYDQQESTVVSDADEKLAMQQLQCWKDGRTGFPWIDAVMRQINQEGWTHHAGRHAVACFLTRGALYISWLRGAAYFQEKLVDMDWPMNVGNWLWVSASCFFSNYRRVASPSTFPQQWDQQGAFVRKYVPALRSMPDKFVHEPWKAPLKVQRDAGCLIGKDYPFPIVDSKLAMSRCLAGMSTVYSDSETDSTASSATSTRTHTDDTETEGSSAWSTDDMCYSCRGPESISRP